MENLEVKIYAPKDLSETWYVYIYHIEEKKIIKRFSKGLKNYKTYEERLEASEIYKSKIEKELKDGWSPSSAKNTLPQPYQNQIKIIDAYTKAYELCENSDRSEGTKKEYRSHYKYFIYAVKKLKWENNRFIDLEPYHITLILEKMISLKKNEIVENAYFNKHLGVVKSFFRILQNNFIIKENKALGISERKHEKKQREILTAEEQTKVINHFQNICPQFITVLKTLYHLGIREKEMFLIKCGMINTKNWYFELPKEITKNKKSGILLIPEDLKKDLLNFDLSNPDYYLFGIPKQRSRWRKNEHFLPSPYKMARSTGTRLWKVEVKDKLGINKDMYSFKHKGVNDKHRNGMPFEVVSKLMRHSTTEITEIYGSERMIIEQEQNKDKFGTFK